MSAGTGQPAEGHAASGSPDLSQDDWQGLKTELGAARHRIAQLENTVEMVLTRLYALERAAVDDEDVHGGQLPGSAALAGSSKRTRIKPLPPVSPVLQCASGQQPEAHGQQPHQDGVYASQRRQSSVRFNQVAPERSNAARIQWPENTLSSLTSPVAGLRKSRSSNGSEHPHGVDGDKGTSVQPEQRQGHALAPGKRFRSAVQDSTGPTLRQSQEKMEEQLYEWLVCSSNAYGAWIHVALQGGLLKATVMTLPMVFASSFVQAIFSAQLLWVHRYDFTAQKQLEQEADLCNQPILLQMCAMAIYVILMSNNIPGMWRAGKIALTASFHKGGDGASIGNVDAADAGEKMVALRAVTLERLIIFAVGVLFEFLTWSLLFVAGIVWINSATDVDLVIRSTVSIMFVLNVDELMYESCCPSNIREDVQSTKYRVRNMSVEAVQIQVAQSFASKFVFRKVVFRGVSLAAKDTTLVHGRTSDAYLILYQDGKQVGKSPVVPHDLNPSWPEFNVKLKGAGGDIRVECWDYDSMTSDDLIGDVVLPVHNLLKIGSTGEFVLHNKHDTSGESAGQIILESCDVDESMGMGKLMSTVRVHRLASLQHFFDVYLYLFVLIGLTICLNWLFKSVVQSDCNISCYWAPCPPITSST